ncbi:Pycsar system effector family protein [Streptomyces sclerotialus]|uniref:Pycsar system effector family protein n=1 Tax=Streptomyces sclerotialus TaxID=1957 RepID=UPI00068B3A26
MTGTEARPPSAARASVPVLTRELIAQNHTEIGRADGKASVLLATGGSLLGLLLMRRPAGTSWTVPLWWAAVIGATGALLLLLMALVPRRGATLRGSAQVLAYYEDVVRAESRAELSVALRLDGQDPQARLSRALTGTSRIAHVKNMYVRWAVLLLFPAVTAMLLALAPG